MRKFCSLISFLLALALYAYEATFTASPSNGGGIPDGWRKIGDGTVKLLAPQPKEIGGEKGYRFAFGSATGTNILCTSSAVIPSGDIHCENVSAHLRVYLQSESVRSDLFQVVISTNNFEGNSYEPIGEPIMLEERGRTVDEWVTLERTTRIEGLSSSGKDVSIGILAGAGGYTSKSGYLQFLKLDFVAVATPRNVHVEVDGKEVSSLMPGECQADVVADIETYPASGEGAVELLKVSCVLDRNGERNKVDMTRDGESTRWRCAVPAPAIEAGESLRVSVCTEYTSTIDTLGEKMEGVAREQSPWVCVTGAKLGSVWVNEFSLDTVELCGTTNRVMRSGWSLVLSDKATGTTNYCADLSGTFDFTTNMINGVVGLETRMLAWRGTDGTPIDWSSMAEGVYVVRLRNPAGIVEHQAVVTYPLAGSVGMVGCATWPVEGGLGYDWTGTATGGVFDWKPLPSPSFGMVNDGQGFKVPVWAKLVVRTEMPGNEANVPLSYATVNVVGRGLGNDADVDVPMAFSEQSLDGVATIVITNCFSVTPDGIALDLETSAFGWQGIPTNLVVRTGSETNADFLLLPMVAEDDFSGVQLNGFWANTDSLVWRRVLQNGDGCLRLDTRATDSGRAVLQCSNTLSPRGHRYAALAFDFMNYQSSSVNADYFRIELTTNANWEATGTIVSTPVLKNKRSPLYGHNEWYGYQTVFEMPEGFAESGEIWVRLVCDSDGGTSSYTTLDNLRIAFQDVALPTGLTRSIEAPVSGEMPAFALEVMPQTTTNGAVEEVSADLHLIVNGVTNIVPFAFADGMLTNALSRGDGEAVAVPMALSAEALQTVLGGPFLTGDVVSYFAAVHYNSANGDTDPAKVYETRYFPDNATTSTVNGTDYWIVEGAYGVNKDLSAHTFTVTGDALSCVGTPTVTTEGVSFTLHGYAEVGISNLTVTVNGTAYTPFEGLDTNAQVRVTGAFSLPTGLAANTDYTVTISAVDVNGVPLKPATFSFTTLPEVTGATIAGVSTNEVKLTVSGAAAGYVVPSGWTPQGAHTWTRNDGTPNTPFTATVYGTNRLGQTSAKVDATPGHTHAAVATWAPVVEKKDATTVTVRADGSYAASDDGNPEGTEYAIRITTSAGATNDVAVWKTLADWREHPETVAAPVLDLEAVNTFSFITRNFDGFVTTNESPVTASCSFPLTADFVDGKVEQKNDGTVAFALTFFDPAGCDGAMAEVQYQLGDGTWQSVCEPFAVVFEELAATRALVWDARVAIGKAPGEYPYSLRARVVSGDRASEWTEVSGTLDFAPPADLTVSGTPASDAVTAERGYAFTLSAHDTHPVSYSWELDGVAGTGETVSGTAAQDGTHTLVVTATDALGNTSAAVTYTWTLDTTAPTQPVLSGTPADGAFANVKGVSLTAASEDATALTYHWTFNGKEMEGEGATFTATAQEGVNTVGVSATDAAGNKSPTTTWSWTVDTIPPTKPVLSGVPGALTNVEAVNLTAASEDATALTYHWTFNGVDATGPSLAGTAREGVNTVNVYATDAAGNVSPPTTWNWTLDTIPPQNLSVNGTPAKDAKTKENAVNLTASATDAHALTYHWTFNGVDSTGPSLVGTAREGKNTARVFAEDAAGNRCGAVTYMWTVDTEKPKNLALDGTPANGAVTKEPTFGFSAKAEDATALTYHWTLKTATDEKTATGETFSGAVEEDGAYTVSVFAEDETGNVSETASRSWTVDRVAPRVELASATSESFNAEKAPLVVAVTFSEPVTDFTADAVTVENGTVTDVEKVGKNEAEDAKETYRVTITPTDDGEVAVQIMAGVVADAAGNGNEASGVLTRTYDTTRPTGTLTSEMTDVFNAAKLVVTATFSEAVTGFTADAVTVENGTVDAVEAVDGDESAYTVTVTPVDEGVVIVQVAADAVADAAGNRNVASAALKRTYDVTPPTRPELSGTPMANTTTNAKEVNLTAASTDAAALTYHWTFNDVDSTGPSLVGTAREGKNTARVFAEDAAGNTSETVTWSWTLDTTAPTVELASETPEPFNAEKAPLVVAVTFSEPVRDFTADAVTVENGTVTDVEKVGKNEAEDAKETYRVTITPEKDGEVAVQIAADAVADAAGNGNTASAKVTRTHDRTPPTVELSCTTPARFNGNQRLTVTATFSESVTDFAASSVSVENGTVDGVTEVAGLGNTYTLTVTPKEDGEVAVWIAADAVADLAGNGNVASEKLTRTYDTAAPTVTLTDVGEVKDLYNAHDVFTVQVAFSEPVTDFTADAVTVENGTVTKFEVKEGTEDAYLVTITPTADGVVSVQIAAGAVTDRAGNGNEASDVRTRTYDITRPTVTRFVVPDSILDEKNSSLDVTVTFSEPVTNFTAESVTVVNCDARAVREAGENTYLFTVVPIKNGTYSIQIAEGVVADAAGNGNVASEVLTRIYDTDAPTKPVISGTPANGSTVRTRAFSLIADATDDASGVKVFRWYINGTRVQIIGKNTLTSEGRESLIHEGVNTVTVEVRDATPSHWSEMSETYTWTYEPGTTTGDVTFGGDVRVKVDSGTGKTNSVSFTAVAFKPGATSTFTLAGFEASMQEITDLQMWFVVCETLNGTPWRVQVNEAARFDSATGELTVTLPPEATLKKPDGEPYSSLFILGIDNKDAAE